MGLRQKLLDIPPTFEPALNAGRVSRSFRFELITPMMGGDAERWKLNLTAPVRAQSVKGQLRFWWRTMQTEDDARQLVERENSLFGGKTDPETRIKSRVSIAVVGGSEPEHEQAKMENAYAVSGDVVPKYVLFPITDKVKNDDEIHFVTDYSFHLRVSYPPEREEEVLNTLVLWCLFGGVGARTRRGCGSIYCEELLSRFKTKEDVYSFAAQWQCNSGAEGHTAPYPQLRAGLMALSPPEKGDKAKSADTWRGLLGKYGDYRQGPGVGRSPGNPRPGRSYWPEPDSLRSICGHHEERHIPENPDRNWFPRAAYGLPIIFKFIDGQDPGRGQQIELKPDGAERWPSPVILKVIRLAGGETVKCCLVLNAAPPQGIRITGPDAGLPHTLGPDEMPLALRGTEKVMKVNDHLRQDETPYTALIRFLGMEVGR